MNSQCLQNYDILTDGDHDSRQAKKPFEAVLGLNGLMFAPALLMQFLRRCIGLVYVVYAEVVD